MAPLETQATAPGGVDFYTPERCCLVVVATPHLSLIIILPYGKKNDHLRISIHENWWILNFEIQDLWNVAYRSLMQHWTKKFGERTSSWTSDWRLEMSGPWQKAARTSTNQNTWTGTMPLSTRELYSIYGELQRLILCCLQLILQGLTPVKCDFWKSMEMRQSFAKFRGSDNLTRSDPLSLPLQRHRAYRVCLSRIAASGVWSCTMHWWG